MSRAAEEEQFMASLLHGIPDDFFSSQPSPSPSPSRPRIMSSLPSATPTSPLASIPVTPVKRKGSPIKRSPKTPKTRHGVSPAQGVDVDDLLAGAEDWDWDDMLTPKKNKSTPPPKKDPVTPTKQGSFLKLFPTPKKLKTPKKIRVKSENLDKSTLDSQAAYPVSGPSRIKEPCTRCIVESVERLDDGEVFQKNLIVVAEPERERRSVILRDDWYHLDIRAGETINVIGTFSTLSSSIPLIIISAHTNLVIHHPDLLLTATAISTASHCTRRPLLSALVRGTSDTTPSLVWGNILHEVMERCLREGTWDQATVDERIDATVQESLGELVKLGIDVKSARREVKIRAKGLTTFAEKYISEAPKPEATLASTRSNRNESNILAIPRLLDVEEDIWSPTYGIKGKLDASVQTIVSPAPLNPRLFKKSEMLNVPSRAAPMPLEIKTGRATAGMEHRAQTLLYTLLMSERYDADVTSGLLYYTQSEEVIEVPRARNEIRGLIMARNSMAAWMSKRYPRKTAEGEHKEADIEEVFLPSTIDDERVCKKCYVLDTCMLYRKAVENVVDESSPIADTYELKTSHLTGPQCAFFKQWETLIALEEQDLLRFRKELWTMTAVARENHGRCFASMVLAPTETLVVAVGTRKTHRIHQFTYRFIRSPSCRRDASTLLSGHMSVGDAITVSIAPDLLGLAKGFITELRPDAVSVGVDHELNVTAYAARMHVKEQQLIFRIDKDELFGGMARVRDNLAQLFYASGDTKRLQLIVDLRPPRFVQDIDVELSERAVAGLNASQQRAIAKVLDAEDYTLILGMPGTGKTTVIAAVIRQLVHMGKTVLLTSYTHSAVDTILLKLKDETEFGILRLGNVDRVHPDVRHFTLTDKRTPQTIEQLEHQLMTPPVVATTCLTLDSPLFSRRKFDVCIVDEASQITLPTCLGPLRYADAFVLVGDHFQLPPLVRNRQARKGGLDVSLFRRLSDAHPEAVVDLTDQYRMNEEIMTLSNKLIYSERLRCGSQAVAEQSLVLPQPEFMKEMHGRSACSDEVCWLDRLTSPSCKAVFVDTDGVPAHDSRIGDLVQNEIEAVLVCQLTEALLGAGITERQIGIISLYRQQLKIISNSLRGHQDIEILTADRSQGRDKDCIIISMVRSNNAGELGDLVKDWRRMNVAFTRAKAKLVIFGSRKTLQELPLLSAFFDLMDAKDWIVNLPAFAHIAHADALQCILSNDAEGRPPLSQTPRRGKATGGGDNLLNSRHILKDVVHNLC